MAEVYFVQIEPQVELENRTGINVYHNLPIFTTHFASGLYKPGENRKPYDFSHIICLFSGVYLKF